MGSFRMGSPISRERLIKNEQMNNVQVNLRIDHVYRDTFANSTDRGTAVSAGVADLETLAAGGCRACWPGVAGDRVLPGTIRSLSLSRSSYQ